MLMVWSVNLMKIIIVGVPCVGKSTVGKILANKINYKFFDFDFEVEKYFDSHITFLKREYPFERTYREKVSVVLGKILKENNDNFIIAMPPSGLMDHYWRLIKKDDSLITIALKDRAKNILERITFYDDYSKPMESPVTKENEKYYLKDISLDIEYFGRSYKKAKIQSKIAGKSAFQVADDLRELLFAEVDYKVTANEL
jgi:shikimate kinase